MRRFKAAFFLVLFFLSSFVPESESYIGVVDSDIYNTVTNFANECVKWRHLKSAALNQFRLWKKLKKFRKKVKFEDEVCIQIKEKYCPLTRER